MTRVLGRPLAEPQADDSPLPDRARQHLLSEGRDLYWNELEWENLMEEEAVDVGEPLIELMFPGLLAFIRGLLLTRVMDDALAPARPRPVVVEDLLRFLTGRLVELEEKMEAASGEEVEPLRSEVKMTDRLVDLVLYLYHGLTEGDVERLETAGQP